jgi:hypothetical protein
MDQKITGNVDIYSFTGIDRDKWFIVGLDFGGGESGLHDPAAIAIDRALMEGGRWTDELVDEHGYLPCVHIQLHDVDTVKLLKVMMHVFDMRLRVRSVLDAEIRIINQLDQPEQPELPA